MLTLKESILAGAPGGVLRRKAAPLRDRRIPGGTEGTHARTSQNELRARTVYQCAPAGTYLSGESEDVGRANSGEENPGNEVPVLADLYVDDLHRAHVIGCSEAAELADNGDYFRWQAP